MKHYAALLVFLVLAAACGSPSGTNSSQEPTSPSVPSIPAPGPQAHLAVTSMGVDDVGQDALGHWRYKVTAHLRGGVDLTVTSIQVRALLGSNLLATASVIPMLSISAGLGSDVELVFAADTRVVDLCNLLTVVMKVEFTDANGNAESLSAPYSGFGCWDY